MKRYISIDAETRQKLMDKYGVTKQTIWEACSFITRNKRGDDIRRDALSMGGRYTEEDFLPNCRTEFQTDGSIRQTFAGNVVVVSTAHGSTIEVDGRSVENYPPIMIKAWSNLLARAQSISEERMLNPYTK